jgi:polyisoprenoid-binding protein YceI
MPEIRDDLSSPVGPGRWQVLHDGSLIQFVVRHLVVHRVRGRFGSFDGTITTGDSILDATVEGWVESKSVDTRDRARDNYIRSADVFDCERWPRIHLRGRIAGRSRRGFLLRSELTILGSAHAVEWDVELHDAGSNGTGTMRLSAAAVVSRKTLGLRWNPLLDTGGAIVGDDVGLTLEIRARRVDPASTGERDVRSEPSAHHP